MAKNSMFGILLILFSHQMIYSMELRERVPCLRRRVVIRDENPTAPNHDEIQIYINNGVDQQRFSDNRFRSYAYGCVVGFTGASILSMTAGWYIFSKFNKNGSALSP